MLPSYTHIVNPKLKHIYLSFDDEGQLVVKSPKISHASIEKLLLKKAAWITKSKEKYLEKKGKTLRFCGKERLYYLGKAYPIELVEHEKKETQLLFDSNTFIVYYHAFHPSLFQKHIDNFYKKTAKETILPLVEKWAHIMQVEFSAVHFRKTKRQWGSCSSSNRLSFNTMMMKLPVSVIEYIVVHELTHITHKHHQKAFWDTVHHYLPTYKTEIAELKKYTTY